METEQELLEAVKAGDRQAMRRLYERYKGYAMSIGLRYIPEHYDVEDVVQDAFINIITSFDFVRHHERISFTGTIPDIADEEPDIESIPPEVLTKMIAQLPSGYRLVLNLHVFEHCSHKEIAQRLGIKEKSSASQLTRAKMILTKMTKEYIKRHGI